MAKTYVAQEGGQWSVHANQTLYAHPRTLGLGTKYPKVSLTVWTAIQAALSGSCVGTIRSKHASHGTQHNRRTIRVARPAFRCPLGPVRHRPAEVRRVRARPRGRVIPEPRKTNHPRRHYYSEASPTTAVLTYGTGPAIIATPTLVTPVRRSHQPGGGVDSSRWRLTGEGKRRCPGPPGLAK